MSNKLKNTGRPFEFNPMSRFDAERCDLCGKCLSACPYLKMTSRRAAREVKRLIDGRDASILKRCAGCMTCSTVCPEGLDPYSLIRARWYERYKQDGLPICSRYLMPHEFPNFRSIVFSSKKEKRLIERFSAPPDSDTVLYTGCNSLVYASVFDSPIFDTLPPFGSLEYCCGEMYYRLGMFDSARESALSLKKVFSRLNAKKMVFTCAACMNMISNVFPREFGIDYPFEKQFISDWLVERIDSGHINISKPINKRVLVQDSCHSKIMGAEMHNSPRRLLERIGADVVETANTRDKSLCCGIAAGCARYDLADMAGAALMRIRDSAASRVDACVTYCNGCQITLSMAGLFTPFAPPALPLLMLVREAAGEKPGYETLTPRALRILSGILINAAPLMALPGRFRMKCIR